MGSQATGSRATLRDVRKLRKVLVDVMATAGGRDVPAICAQIRQARKRRQEQWAAENPGGKGNPYTMEAVAARVPMSAKAYGDIERGRSEPNMARLRSVAAALGLDEDYFLPSGDLASATARVEAEADRLTRQNDAIESALLELRSLIAEQRDARSRG